MNFSQQLSLGYKDIRDSFLNPELWFRLGWQDIRNRYRRSILGPFWITLSAGAMAAGLGLLYAVLLNQPIHDYLPYMAAGIISWNFIAGIINELATTYPMSESLIKQIRAPLSSHICRTLFRNLMLFAHNLVILIPVYVCLRLQLSWNILWFIPGTLALLILAFLTALWLSPISVRFRDLPPLIQNIVQLGFFLTPVTFHINHLKGASWIARYNPLYYCLDLIRAPLLCQEPNWDAWCFVLGAIAVMLIPAWMIFSRVRGRIAYWV